MNKHTRQAVDYLSESKAVAGSEPMTRAVLRAQAEAQIAIAQQLEALNLQMYFDRIADKPVIKDTDYDAHQRRLLFTTANRVESLLEIKENDL